MIQTTTDPTPLAPTALFRDWVRREMAKDQYPTATPTDWEQTRLREELATTYEEPIDAATRGDPTWIAVTVDGTNNGTFAPFPERGWKALSKEGTIADAVDRLRTEDLTTDYPEATDTIDSIRNTGATTDFGAVVAREYAGEWPPLLLDGNHRACATNWLAREGSTIEVEIHLGIVTPIDDLPLQVID